MDATGFRSSRGRMGAAVLLAGFLVLEAAIGGRAVAAMVQQVVQISPTGHYIVR